MGNVIRKLLIFSLTFMIFASPVKADEWQDEISKAESNSLSKYKRKTKSGQRVLREKLNRISQIDMRVPELIKEGDYDKAEKLLRESLRLTIEFYGTTENIYVAERFTMLGIMFMESGDPAKAVEAFKWARNIGESLFGKGDYRLANIYRFLAAAYYYTGDYVKAEMNADTLLSIYVAQYGPGSPQVNEAKDLLKDIYKAAE